MSQTMDQVRAMVRERFCRVASTPTQEKKFPVGPEEREALAHAKRSKATLLVAKLNRLARNVATQPAAASRGIRCK